MNSYDQTKSMLNMMRKKINESKQNSLNFLNEQENDQYNNQDIKDDIHVINDVDIKLISGDGVDLKLMDDQKAEISTVVDGFKNDVSMNVDFEPGFSLTPNQIRLDGKLLDNDLTFVLISGNEAGVYINAEMLKLDVNSANTLEKLAKFYENSFKNPMNSLLDQRRHN